MTTRFLGSSIFTNILEISPISFLTLNQFIWNLTVATLVICHPWLYNIFNAPANVVPCGRLPSPHSHWSPSLMPPQPVPHHHGSVRTDHSTIGWRCHSASASSTTSCVHCPEKHGHSTDCSLSTGPPKKLLKCEWCNGETPTRRPGAWDYELKVSSLILKSIREFEACVITQDPAWHVWVNLGFISILR